MSDSELVTRHKVIMRAGLRMLDDLPLTADQRIEIYAAIAYLRERAQGTPTKPSVKPPGFVSRIVGKLTRR